MVRKLINRPIIRPDNLINRRNEIINRPDELLTWNWILLNFQADRKWKIFLDDSLNHRPINRLGLGTELTDWTGIRSLRSFFQGPKWLRASYMNVIEIWLTHGMMSRTHYVLSWTSFCTRLWLKKRSQLTIIHFVKRIQNVQDGVMRNATWSQFSLTFNNNNNNTKFIR